MNKNNHKSYILLKLGYRLTLQLWEKSQHSTSLLVRSVSFMTCTFLDIYTV